MAHNGVKETNKTLSYAELKEKIQNLVKERPFSDPLEIVAVTKYATLDQMRKLQEKGCAVFGENKVQDLLKKQEVLQLENQTWKFIGHLQSNKVRKLVGNCAVIQSVDSVKLAEKIDAVAKEYGITQRVLLQVNLEKDPNKSGFTEDEVREVVSNFHSFPNMALEGIMIVVPAEENSDRLRGYFKQSRTLFESLKETCSTCTTLSMGMSNDFELAVQEGATQIRLGSILLDSI